MSGRKWRVAVWLGVVGALAGLAAAGAAAAPNGRVAAGAAATGTTASPVAPGVQTTIEVKGFSISGNKTVGTERLTALLDDAVGQWLTLAQIQALAGRIKAYYRAQGYVVADAYAPAQSITDGQVRIAVVEGQYGRIVLQDDGRLRPEAAAMYLEGIKPGEPIRQGPLARALLLLSDIPGVRLGTALSAGAAPGASDLRLTLQEGPLVRGRLALDDYGNASVGAVRSSAHVELDDPVGVGDTFSLDMLSGGRQLQSGRFVYSVPIGGQGLSGGLAYSASAYHLGGAFAALAASGVLNSVQLHLDDALERTALAKVTASLRYEQKSSLAAIGGGYHTTTTKRFDRTTLGLQGDRRAAGGPAVSYGLNLTTGFLQIEPAAARQLDAASGRTAGAYALFNASADLTQAISARSSLQLHLQGQVASKNLDAAERMALGGPGGLRGYEVGEAAGDQGWLARAEWTRAFVLPGWRGRTNWALFWDGGSVQVNRNPWSGSGGERWITLNDAGAGLDWRLDAFSLSLRAAHPMGPDQTVSPAPPWRILLQSSWSW